MGRKKKKPVLPSEGAAFAFPLDDGRFSVCRILLGPANEESKRQKQDVVLVAGSTWIGTAVPDAKDASLRPILYLTHHSWKNKPQWTWVDEPPPEDFIPIGTIPPTPDEKETECLSFGGWGSIRVQPLAQWRWDNDRQSVLAEDEQAEARRNEGEQSERAEYLAGVTLDTLQERKFFPNWKTSPSRKAIRASRQIMTDTVEKLLELGKSASKSKRKSVLKDCIQRFNSIDVELDHFIETIEREDICEEFEAIVHACGLGDLEDLADEWREW